MGLERFIKLIKEGEPVSPGTPNRPLQQIDQNTQYLWDVLQAAEVGSTVYARMQTVASTLTVGQPVYFNSNTSQFEAAYATTDTDTTTGYLTTAAQSQVWGILAEKHNATSGDILLFGYAKVDISSAIPADQLNGDGSVPAGIWYLSSMATGLLTKQQPPVSVPVLKTDNSGYVFVNPKFIDFIENHRHYVFDLEMLPAGEVTPPLPGNTHSITNPDENLPGWLPANHAVFAGKAPLGAKFGYNLTQNTGLSNLYPPVPLQSAVVTMQKPSIWDDSIADTLTFGGVSSTRKWYGQQLMGDLVTLDQNGIWWMSDCYDEVPWPTDLDTNSSVSESVGTCSSAAQQSELKLYYTRVNFATDNAVVTSLSSIDDRIKLTCAGTIDPGSTGDLEIDLDLSLSLGDDNSSGFLVFKEFNSDTGVFSRGPVAEGLYATSNNIVLEGSSQAIDSNGNTVYYGNIGLGIVEQFSQELSSQLVRLDGVTEEDYPALYLGMPNDNLTSYVVKFEVPTYAPSNSNFKFRARLIGRSAGTLPPITTTYYKVARPSGTTPLSVTQSYTSLSGFDPTSATLTSANQAVEIESNSISVSPGDIVYIKVERDPDAVNDNYGGELGVMQQVGVMTSS